jgi:hypothetical protein
MCCLKVVPVQVGGQFHSFSTNTCRIRGWLDSRIGLDDMKKLKFLTILGFEPPGSVKYWEIFEWLSNWRLLKKGQTDS